MAKPNYFPERSISWCCKCSTADLYMASQLPENPRSLERCTDPSRRAPCIPSLYRMEEKGWIAPEWGQIQIKAAARTSTV